MKATRSADGKVRFTVSVKYRIGFEELVDAIGYYMATSVLPSHPVDWVRQHVRGRGWVIATFRSKAHYTHEHWTWADIWGHPEVRPVLEERIGELFPELIRNRTKTVDEPLQ